MAEGAFLGGCRIAGVVLSVYEKNGWYRGRIGIGHSTYEFSTRQPLEVGQKVQGDARFYVDDKFGRLLVEWWSA